MAWLGRVLALLLFGIFLLFVVAFGALLMLQIPQNAAGMAAKTVCSSTFVGGRPDGAGQLMTTDVLPASPALSLISTSIDTEERSATSRFFALVIRRASLLPDRGCVLDAEPDPAATPYTPVALNPQAWPEGDAVSTTVPAGVDTEALDRVVQRAFVGAGDPTAANARAVAVVVDGSLVAVHEDKAIPQGAALHGWSMTKTVAGMLLFKRAAETGLDLQTPVVNAFRPGREPSWVQDWRGDERRDITVADLLYMRDGLQNDEGYGVTGSVVQMLYGEPNMAAWAAGHPAAHPAGTYWQYLSATSVILADVTRGLFDTDAEYWAYPRTALFDPIGVRSGTLETDTNGTWVGSSYQWADVRDWARLGQLMLADGTWQGRDVLPAGWLDVATAPAMPSGEGHGYGGQTWLLGDPVAGQCRTYPGVPADTLAMDGHWGQVVAMVPSRNAVIVRLGWTFDKSQFDECAFISDVVATLPKSAQ